jgi:hypothetical protein
MGCERVTTYACEGLTMINLCERSVAKCVKNNPESQCDHQLPITSGAQKSRYCSGQHKYTVQWHVMHADMSANFDIIDSTQLKKYYKSLPHHHLPIIISIIQIIIIQNNPRTKQSSNNLPTILHQNNNNLPIIFQSPSKQKQSPTIVRRELYSNKFKTRWRLNVPLLPFTSSMSLPAPRRPSPSRPSSPLLCVRTWCVW